MNRLLMFLAPAFPFAAGAPAARAAAAGCETAARPGAYKGYVILDQSPRSDAFQKTLRTLARPDLVAINRVKGNYSRIKVSAERHPVAYIITDAGTALPVKDAVDFVRRMNALAPCQSGAKLAAGARP